ncbi:hypothetical protein DRI50_08740 [candidate division KSB1 bacterium]|nr:MAG: hypothetical protein DRI50_08740 [candidate division KSB1 bacterium]
MGSELAQEISSSDSVWKSIQDVLKEYINIRSFNTWFAPIELVNLDDKTIELRVPNRFFCEWIDNHYAKLLNSSIVQVLGEPRKIKYHIKNSSVPESPYVASDLQPAPTGKMNRMEMPGSAKAHSPFYTRINERYTFDNFIVGDGNNFAYAAARAVANSPGRTNYNPLIIYGGTGLGKTHLIQAIGNYALAQYPRPRFFIHPAKHLHLILLMQFSKTASPNFRLITVPVIFYFWTIFTFSQTKAKHRKNSFILLMIYTRTASKLY